MDSPKLGAVVGQLVMECKTCFYFHEGEQMSLCTRFPPTVFMFFQGPAIQGGQQTPMFASQYPPVRPGQSCGEYTIIDDLTEEEKEIVKNRIATLP
jgi:hypothetical protein